MITGIDPNTSVRWHNLKKHNYIAIIVFSIIIITFIFLSNTAYTLWHTYRKINVTRVQLKLESESCFLSLLLLLFGPGRT